MKYAKIDLHLHLDGSLYLPWAYETAKKEDLIPKDWKFEDYFAFMYKKDYKTMEEGFKKFEYTCDVMQTKENLKMSIWHLIRTLHEQKVFYAEIRYASQQHCKKGLTQAETIEALIEGMNQAKIDFPDVEVGLINCMMHKGDNALFNMKENLETIEATKKYLGKGVVGIDLAGYENTGNFMLYKPLFDKIKEYGIPCTCHAGEMGEGSHIHDAIVMGANRIGHGINCVQKPEWLKEVVDTQIPLEVCVSSNQGNANYELHPIRDLIKAGVKVTVNTDNMMFSQTTLAHEHNMLLSLGVSQEELYQCELNAIDVAFCSEEVKEKVREKLKALHDEK